MLSACFCVHICSRKCWNKCISIFVCNMYIYFEYNLLRYSITKENISIIKLRLGIMSIDRTVGGLAARSTMFVYDVFHLFELFIRFTPFAFNVWPFRKRVVAIVYSYTQLLLCPISLISFVLITIRFNELRKAGTRTECNRNGRTNISLGAIISISA